MDSGFKLVNNSVDYRNKGSYSKASKALQSGSGKCTRALRFYKSAEALYPKADFTVCISALVKAKVAVRYKQQLDYLGLAGNLERYNKVRKNSNAAWHAAVSTWKRTSNRDDGSVVDKAYTSSVRDLLTRISEKTSSASAKDGKAGSLTQPGTEPKKV